MMLSSRLFLRFGPVLVLVLGACQTMEDFARSVDEAAATIIPGSQEASAQASEAERSYQLGLKQLNGDGVAQNDRVALELFEKAAALGHPEAQYLTGRSYASGRGTAIDLAWAARWYGKAAEQGHAKAQHMLGMAYASAQGLPRDRIAAYTWLSLAASQKDADALRERDALARKMKRPDIELAERRVSQWQPAPNDQFADQPTVRFAQVALADLGFPPGPIDGKMGQRTHQALAKYQAKAGLTGDGALTPSLLDKLRSDRLPVASVAKTAR